jgi:hypothetical protein
MEGTPSPLRSATMVGISKAARILQDLGICKAFGPSGRINGPNCQRFGKRDPSTGRWSWDVAELIEIANKKKTVSAEVIETIATQYGLPPPSIVDQDRSRRKASRAQLEKNFHDEVRGLESIMRRHLPWQRSGLDRRALGDLIKRATEMQIFTKAKLAEVSFVNVVRNSLNHPGLGDISDDDLTRATASASAAVVTLKEKSHRYSD